MIILTMFAVLLFLLSINVPIAIGLAVTTIVAMVLKTGTSFLIDKSDHGVIEHHLLTPLLLLQPYISRTDNSQT